MKIKKIMSLLVAAAFIIPFFNINRLNVKAETSGQPSIPVAVGKPYQMTVNEKTVTAQDYEVSVPYIDSDITTNYYEKGYKDASEVLSKIKKNGKDKIKVQINGKDLEFNVTNNVNFKEDDAHDDTFPKKVNNKITLSCGTEDNALYQSSSGGYTLSSNDLLNSFPSTIDVGFVDTNSNGSYNGNYALVWRGDKDNNGTPILAAEPYQGFYPSINGGTTAPLKRRPYKVTKAFSIQNKNMNLNLTTVNENVFVDVPQGQSFDSSKSYEFDAITSNLLHFNYTPIGKDKKTLLDKDGKPVKDVSYTTLSNPLTPEDLRFFYPDYYDSSQYTTRKIVDVSGSKFSSAGTITRTNSAGVTQTVTRYVATIQLGRIEPSATYTYTADDDLWLPTVTYKGTVYSDGPISQSHNLTVHYIDKATGSDIDDKYNQTSPYTPSAPSGYDLTGNYRTSATGTDIAYNGSIRVNLSSRDKTIYVMCQKQQGDYKLTVHYLDEATNNEISNMSKGYASSEVSTDDILQMMGSKAVGVWYLPTSAPSGYTLDTDKFSDKTRGYHIAWNVGSSFIGNGRSTSSAADLKVYCKKDSTHVDPIPDPDPNPTPDTGTVIKRYFLDGEEQKKDEEKETNISVGSHSYSVDKQYPRHTCSNPTVTVDVTADNTTYCDFNFEFENHPPTVTLQGVSTVVMGDDFSVYASGVDPDDDPLTYDWNTPSDFKGSSSEYTASGYFENTGDKTFGVKATDPYGLSDSTSKVVKVVPPIPNVVIDKSGTEKENRKVTLNAEKYSSSGSNSGRYSLDWNKAKWQFFDGRGKELTVDNNAISSTIVKSLDSTIGSKNMDLIFKKAGKYTAKCTLYNTAEYSNSFSVDLNIAPDLAPTADFNFPDGNNGYRDGKDLSPNGLAQGTDKLVDSSKSRDEDNIGKRMWLACFDSDNDGNFIDITKNEDGTKKAVPEKEKWFIYDLDYNGNSDTRYKVQVPDSTPLNGKLVTVGSDGHKYAYINDSLNPHWRYVGSYDDIKKLDINKINCGNLTSVNFKSTSCGHFYYAEVIEESFGQETIPELITDKDKKQANTFEF